MVLNLVCPLPLWGELASDSFKFMPFVCGQDVPEHKVSDLGFSATDISVVVFGKPLIIAEEFLGGLDLAFI